MKIKRVFLAILLTISMLTGLLPGMAFAETRETVILTEFKSLENSVSNQTVKRNTRQYDLNLPATLEAMGYPESDEPDEPEAMEVPVASWIGEDASQNAYNHGAAEGSYTFKPQLETGFALNQGVDLPEITVQVTKEEDGATELPPNEENVTENKDADHQDIKDVANKIGALGSGVVALEQWEQIIGELKITYTIQPDSIDSTTCAIIGTMLEDKNPSNSINPENCEVVIPGTINDKTVVEIASNCFYDSSGGNAAMQGITEITIPDSVTKIGNNNFCGLGNLTSLNLGKGLKDVGDNCFNTLGLSKVTIPASMTGTLGKEMFFECEALENVDFKSPKTSLGDGSFAVKNAPSVGYSFIDRLEFSINGASPGEVGKYASKHNIRCSYYDTLPPAAVSALTNIVVTQSGEGEVTYPDALENYESATVRITPENQELYDVKRKEEGVWKSILSEFEKKVENGVVYYEKDFTWRETTSTITPLELHVIFNGWDYYSFSNSLKDFTGGGNGNYLPHQTHLQIMSHNLRAIYKDSRTYLAVWNLINYQALEDWGGSCFGFAATEGLFNQEKLSVQELNTTAKTVSQLEKPVDNMETKSLLNYYYLTQFLSDLIREDAYYVGNEFSRRDLKKLVENVQSGKRVMFSYYFGTKPNYYGHAFTIDGYEGVGEDGSFRLIGRDNRLHGFNYAEVANGFYRDTGIPATVTVEVDGDYNGARVIKDTVLITDGQSVYQFAVNEEVVAFEAYYDFNGDKDDETRFDAVNIQDPLARLLSDFDSDTFYVDTNELNMENGKGEALYLLNNGAVDPEKTTMNVIKQSFTVGGMMNEGELINTPSTKMFEIENEGDYICTSSTDDPLSGRMAILTDSTFSSAKTQSAEKVQLNQDGSVEIKQNKGDFKAAVTLNNNDGNMLIVTGNTSGDILIVPTKNGVEFTAPSGKYDVNFIGDDGDSTSKTVTSNGNMIILTKAEEDSSGFVRRGSSGASRVNQPKITKNDGGTVTVTTDGKRITITPAEGYHLETLTVNGSVIDQGDDNGQWKDNGTVIYTFDKASRDNTADIVFAPDGFEKTEPRPEEPSSTAFPFADVREGDWYYSAVKYAYENNLFLGLSATQFGPNEAVTRGMLASVINRMEASPLAMGSNPFVDIKQGAYYENGILWANENNIMSGYSDTQFGPDDAITREQLAAVLYRYAIYKGAEKTTTDLTAFTDTAAISPWAKEAMEWAVANGILSGKGGGLLDPQGKATRGEVASMLQRFQQNF